ncbi:estradiol 17-beta-dehydrogenase 2 [Anabrus simplex]|uniref:estradiol 17-beta-dehydrogenase 2 n=1 Tax=Anabrus simplex TaxID=316456 RepID=UPI0034DCE310
MCPVEHSCQVCCTMGSALSRRLRLGQEKLVLTAGLTFVACVVRRWGGCSITAAACGLGLLLALAHFWRRNVRLSGTECDAVLITGCDSGLGYSLALHSHRLGLTVFAGCLDPNGPGAKQLAEKCGKERFFIIELDVTKQSSILQAHDTISKIISTQPQLRLKAIVNNAGVMVFGEFEWQTENLIANQINVNFLGTLNVTKTFIHLLRIHKGRIITVTSHCAKEALPGLATYGGTKAALKAWSDGLRVELAKYGVSVITVIPGSFAQQSNILSRQRTYMLEMQKEMTSEAQEFYGDYFFRYNEYLCGLSSQRDPEELNDSDLYHMYEDALLSQYPQPHYEHGPLRYTIYHFMFKYSPIWLRDKLVLRFMQMPQWKPM